MKRALLAILLFANSISFAADKTKSGKPMASMGFTENYIIGNAKAQGYKCPYWPGTTITQCSNIPTMSLTTLRGYLDALKAQGVTVNKDIISVHMLENPANYKYITNVLKEYQARGFKVVIELSFPFPGTFQNLPCFPSVDADFEKMVYQRIANPLVYLIKHLKTQLNPTWVDNNLIISPWGEFDATPTLAADKYNCVKNADGSIQKFMNGSPRKAAILQGATAYAFWVNGLKTEVAMPSLVNVYHGKMSSSPKTKYDTTRIYLQDYYNTKIGNGKGRPNIHLYYGAVNKTGITATEIVTGSGGLMEYLKEVVAGTPTQYKGKILITEGGFGDNSGTHCTTGLPTATKEQVYTLLPKQTLIHQNVDLVVLWRLFQLPIKTEDGNTLQHCEGTFGVVKPTAWQAGYPGTTAFTNSGLNYFKATRDYKAAN